MNSDSDSDTDITDIEDLELPVVNGLVWRLPLRSEDISLPKEGYKSVQSAINSNEDGSLNENRYRKYLSILTKRDFYKVTNYDTVLKLIGKRFVYTALINNVLKFRSGGFLVNVFEEYVQYKGFNRAIYHIQKHNIIDIYIKLNKKELEKHFNVPDESNKVQYKRPIITPRDKHVFMIDEVPIKKFRNKYDYDNFLLSKKCAKTLKYGYQFV